MNKTLLTGALAAFTIALAGCNTQPTASEPTNLSADVQAYIDQQVETQVAQALEENRLVGEAFDEKASEAITRFISNQQRAQREAQQQQAAARAKNAAPVSAENDFIRGPLEAEFTLIEYSDYECPYCKRFHDTAKRFIERNDNINWVHRHFPLDFHNPGAQKQAEAAECAGELGGREAFWAYSDAIYERTTSGGEGFPVANLIPLSQELGLDQGAFTQCLESGQMTERVIADLRNGQQAGVSGTPGNILRHNPTGEVIPLSGAQPLANLEAAFSELRNRVE